MKTNSAEYKVARKNSENDVRQSVAREMRVYGEARDARPFTTVRGKHSVGQNQSRSGHAQRKPRHTRTEKPQTNDPTEAHASPWGHFRAPSRVARARRHIPRRLRTRALLPSISCIVSFDASRTPKRASSVGDWRRGGGARPESRYEAGRRDARVPGGARQYDVVRVRHPPPLAVHREELETSVIE